jgi:hypothetical protein
MSKVDAMRALKQARLEQLRKAAPAQPAVARPAAPARAAAPAPEAQSGLCGHRNMGGRACTRAAGHSEKSHRYG